MSSLTPDSDQPTIPTSGGDDPVGNHILNGLLQNADDAGATFFELIFDPGQYPTTPLVHPSLAEYQGPSLLVYYNSVFTPRAFEGSLKFCRLDSPVCDLSSVYNWTDCPSILSGSSLLILDPQLSWSADLGPSYTGGPSYDFIRLAGKREIKNHLAAFGALQANLSTEFVGTAIRIPLRAKKRDTGADALAALEDFRKEMVEALLFLKNIVEVLVRIVGEDGVYARAELLDKEGIAVFRGSIVTAFREIFVDRTSEAFETCFPVLIYYRGRDQDERTFEWNIFHYIQSRFEGRDELVKWGKGRGLVPWVALAVLQNFDYKEQRDFSGRLFCIGPLQIRTEQPIHIHGMFSLTPDRMNIHQAQGSMVKDQNKDQASRWNSVMFNECLTYAWSRFLGVRAVCSGGAGVDLFRYWPRSVAQEPLIGVWGSFIEVFFESVIGNGLPIWPTCLGFMAANELFLARGEAEVVIHIFGGMGMPTICPPEVIYDAVERYFEGRVLTPTTAAGFLREISEEYTTASQDTKIELLEYLLSGSPEAGYHHLGDIKLFPMCDGSFTGCGVLSSPAMLPMDENEMSLFSLWPHMTVDVSIVGVKAMARLKGDIERVEKETSLRQWRLKDVYEYCMATHFSEINPYTVSDVIEAKDIVDSRCFSDILGTMWDWITSQLEKGTPESSLLGQLGDLWLVPLMGGRYRCIRPSKRLVLDPASGEGLGIFLKPICKMKVDAYGTNQLYCSDVMSNRATELLRKQKIVMSCDELKTVMDWLGNGREFVSLFSSSERHELVRFLDILAVRYFGSGNGPGVDPQLVTQLKQLPVFEEITNNLNGTSLNLTTLEKTGVKKYVAVMMESVIPNIKGVVFVNARSTPTLRLVREFGLAEIPEISQLLGEYILPGIAVEVVPNITRRLAEFALQNSDFLPAGGIVKMADLEFVPVYSRGKSGVVTKELKAPRHCIDPDSGLGGLFFDHENVWIEHDFWKIFSKELRGMQVINKITVELVLDRVKAYADVSKRTTKDELAEKAKALITTSAALEIPCLKNLKGRPWLPTRKHSGTELLMESPESCRDQSFTGLVGYVMPIVQFTVGKSWSRALAWDFPLPSAAIRNQIEVLVDRREFLGLEVILDYLAKIREVENYLDDLREAKWIVGVSGEVFRCDDIFFKCAVRLNPACDCLSPRSGNKYRSFFQRLGVQESPSLLKLKQLIDGLDQYAPVSGVDLELAINAIILATELYPKGDFTKLKAPDYMSMLRELPTLTVGEPQYFETELFFLHPRIPQQSINVLGVPSFSQTLEVVNDQEDAPINTKLEVIKSTIKSFPVECMFNEFLAISEESGTATKVGWVLDRSESWEKTSQLSKQLKGTMGPGLLYWSDAILDEKNFGLVGFEGKDGDETRGVGRFDSGLLTMYHWTNLPQIICEGDFIILDPEERYLPLNSYTKRRHWAMKISLMKMQKSYPDHLKPFYGTLGFGPTSETVNGTMFWFPFRQPGCGTQLVPGHQLIDSGAALRLMKNYFTEAKISLLFLSRITSIEFQIKGSDLPEWRVSITRVPVGGKIANGTIEQLFIESRQFSPTLSITNDEWVLVYSNDSDNFVLGSFIDAQREYKLGARCGIAALVSPGSKFEGKFFKVMPFRWSSGLPVHIHAPFVTTGDLHLVPTARGDRGIGLEWNLWVVQRVVDLYLDFLRCLARSHGEFAFQFWPPQEGFSEVLSQGVGKRFWERIWDCSSELFPVVEPKADKYLAGSESYEAQVQARKCLSLKEIVFDFLEPQKSALLRTLLVQLGVRNIVRPAKVISDGLRNNLRITEVDATYIIRLLKESQEKDILRKTWADCNYALTSLGPLLEFILKKPPLDLSVLSGCRIIPLADRTLGVLGNPASESISKYYISSQIGRLDIFEYAPGLVLHPDLSQAMADILFKLNLNVSIMPFSDLARLFEGISESDKTSTKFHEYLRRFWVSMNYEYDAQIQSDNLIMLDVPVYSATVNGQLRALSPKEFQSFPTTVSPSDCEELEMCTRLPGLYLVDPRTIPSGMKNTEKLTEPAGLVRFLTSLEKLARLKHKTPETFVPLFLKSKHMILLRRLLKNLGSTQMQSKYPSAMHVLKALPVWPTMSGKLVSAVDALLIPDARFCVSWIEGKDRLIERDTSQEFMLFLEGLEVRKLEASNFVSSYCRNTRNQTLELVELNNYRSFTEAYIDHIGRIPPESVLALDGNCRFRRPDTLYDSSESIFFAAFRDLEKKCFLHPRLRHLREWYIPGLISRVSGPQYYECAINISKRAGFPGSRETLEIDAATVFEHLWTKQTFIQEHWTEVDLRRIRVVQFVPLLHNFASQPQHRRDRMRKVSSTSLFGSLVDCVIAEFLMVCWSQCPIYATSPGDYVLRNLPSHGSPSIQVVFRHIEFLAANRSEVRSLEDIQLYVTDILASYKFLDDYYSKQSSQKARGTDPGIRGINIWLNLDELVTNETVDLFESSWVSAKDLCLGIEYDFSNYRCVRSMLLSYKHLLVALEVKQVQKPKLEITAPDPGEQKTTRGKLISFWLEGILCDIELVTDEKSFKAHRLILATSSPYWESVFTSNLGEKGDKIVLKEATPHTVFAMLHFLYTGELPPIAENKDPGEYLGWMMGWLSAANQWDMALFKGHVEEGIIKQSYVRPENVRQVLGMARESQARLLAQYCEAYINANRRVVERIGYLVV